jgi:hypothetical protein
MMWRGVPVLSQNWIREKARESGRLGLVPVVLRWAREGVEGVSLLTATYATDARPESPRLLLRRLSRPWIVTFPQG